jgi:hypothetical protein
MDQVPIATEGIRRETDGIVKFGILVGLAGIFIDAIIAHGLFWENDPYWTYWITKTFLITTVFSVGTAYLGMSIRSGVIITLIHTLILEVYYQWLAPVGLPQEPEWLDFNHLWITGFPAHYLAILCGYFIALWLWRRSHAGDLAVTPQMRSASNAALLAAVTVIVLDGIITSAILMQDFPGITYFVQRLLVTYVFMLFWITYAGLDWTGVIVGGLMLSLVWTSYSMYLGPQGLPDGRIHYLGYDDLWTRSFPGALLSTILGLTLFRYIAGRTGLGRGIRLMVTITLLTASSGVTLASDGLPASASAGGTGMMATGPDPNAIMKSSVPMQGSISVHTIERGNRWSHIQNTDSMLVDATFVVGSDSYRVVVDRPMPRHPLGWYTTWNGVVYRHEMHGETGIGTSRMPKMKPEIALWGWCRVERNGVVIAASAPAHVMVTTEGEMKGIMLEVNTEERNLGELPGGYLAVMWHQIGELSMPESRMQTRQIIGWIALVILTAGFGWLAHRMSAKQPALHAPESTDRSDT